MNYYLFTFSYLPGEGLDGKRVIDTFLGVADNIKAANNQLIQYARFKNGFQLGVSFIMVEKIADTEAKAQESDTTNAGGSNEPG